MKPMFFGTKAAVLFTAGLGATGPAAAQTASKDQAAALAQLSPIGAHRRDNKAAAAATLLRAPAPALTSVAIYAVGSDQYGGYEITYGKSITTGDHGGAMSGVFEEWGYGTNRIAHMAGNLLPSSAMYESDPICGGTPGSPDLNCPPGSTAVGFVYFYDLDGYDSGLFTVQSTSINFPQNTYTASIQIR